jgi:hypothetical protein
VRDIDCNVLTMTTPPGAAPHAPGHDPGREGGSRLLAKHINKLAGRIA